MAPKRGSGSRGSDTTSDSSGEKKMTLTCPDDCNYKKAYIATAIIAAVFMALLFFLLIWSSFNKVRRWRTARKTRYLTITIWISVFWFIARALTFATALAVVLEATVFQSFVLTPSWTYTFELLGELLLISALYYILHNRLRSVGIHNLTVVKIAFIHWALLVLSIILALVSLIGNWGYSATSLLAMNDTSYIGKDRQAYSDYIYSDFFRNEVRRDTVAFYFLRFFIQLEMVAVGIWILVKSTANPGGRKPMLLLLCGSLVAYTISPLSVVIIELLAWDDLLHMDKRPWFQPLELALYGAPGVVCLLFICIFAVVMDRAQWELGTTQGRQETEVVAAGAHKAGDGPTGVVYETRQLDANVNNAPPAPAYGYPPNPPIQYR